MKSYTTITREQLDDITTGISALFDQRTSVDQESGTDNHLLDAMSKATGELSEEMDKE